MRRQGPPGHRIVDNPFYVLGVTVDCARVEMEREGQKLLGMLELGLRAAASYHTPLGRFERTAEKVREAMAELRDPDRRLGHELWARLEPELEARGGDRARQPDRAPGAGDPEDPRDVRPDIAVALGWRRG